MEAPILKELYNSPNGDRWALSKDGAGKLVVLHEPNKSSDGRPSEIAVDVFLSQGDQGPKHQALARELAALGVAHGDDADQELSADHTEKLSHALGLAVARCWSSLPQEIQHQLFEAAVSSEGKLIRQQLAVFLHGKHERTVDAAQAKAVLTPDSPGG